MGYEVDITMLDRELCTKILAGENIGEWANLNQLEGKTLADELHVRYNWM